MCPAIPRRIGTLGFSLAVHRRWLQWQCRRSQLVEPDRTSAMSAAAPAFLSRVLLFSAQSNGVSQHGSSHATQLISTSTTTIASVLARARAHGVFCRTNSIESIDTVKVVGQLESTHSPSPPRKRGALGVIPTQCVKLPDVIEHKRSAQGHSRLSRWRKGHFLSCISMETA